MESLQILRSINEHHDHAGLIPFHQLIQLVLDCIAEARCMFDDQILSRQPGGHSADAALI